VAPDAAREKAIAGALLPRVRADQAVWLDVDGAKVLALYDGDIDGKPHGTAVILHGMDANPDMHGVVHALRTRLVHYGWSTLSVQLPVLPPGTAASAYAGTLTAAGKRLQAALAYLKTKQPGPVVLVGYEYGGLVALQVAGGTPAGIAAIAALDLSGTRDILAPAEVNAMLEKVRVPVLDLYGALDSAARLDLAPPRAAAARKAGNAAYRQEPLAGTDEHFTGMAQPVAGRVSAWLDKMLKVPPRAP
jgi:pimeloyl-ACP methyl ester carboxylesterase